MSANPRALMPATTPVERTRVFQDEWAVRYGILMGGTKVINLDGIGQYFVGHHQIPRRALVGFTRQQVRGRNEAQDSADLDQPGGGLLMASPLDSKRLVDKSPAECMREMIVMQGDKGFVNSRILMGDETTADQLFNVVLPVDIAELPLVDVITFLEDKQYIGKSFLSKELQYRADKLREEDLLPGAYIARAHMTSYTNAVSEEVGQVADGSKKTGKRGVDSVDIEYFWELKRTLPKDRPLEATSRLGKEIAGAIGRSNDNSEIAAEMREANRLKAEELEIRRQELGLTRNDASLVEVSEVKRGPGRPRLHPEQG